MTPNEDLDYQVMEARALKAERDLASARNEVQQLIEKFQSEQDWRMVVEAKFFEARRRLKIKDCLIDKLQAERDHITKCISAELKKSLEDVKL